MPETFEDTLPMAVAMNRDYDQERMGEGCVPLPDCTPGVDTLPNAAGDDELRSAAVALPSFTHSLWKLNIPGELRVWRWDATLQTWSLVESGVEYSAAASGATFNLLVEGLQPSATPDNFIVLTCRQTNAENNPLGLPVSDSVKVEVVAIDIEIAQITELDEETQPAFVPVNDDYDEQNAHGISGDAVTDNNRLHDQLVSVAPRIDSTDDDLVHAKLTIDGPNGQHGKYWIEVLNEPATVNGLGTGQGGYPGYEQYIRVWLPNGTAVPRDAANALPITLDANAVDLLIEGLAAYYNSQYPIRLIAHFEPDGDYEKADIEADVIDSITARVINIDLDADVDSKNDSGYAIPDNNVEEDRIEQDSSTGKIVWASIGDIDGDGITDYEDFDGIIGGQFVPMVLRLSENINDVDPSQILISINYNDSILRIWKPGKDAPSARTTNDIITSGNNIIASDMGLFPGGSVVVYIEALQSNSSTLPITVHAIITGEHGSGILTDILYVAAAEFKYVRVYDAYKVPNRSTRAVGVPEDVLNNTR